MSGLSLISSYQYNSSSEDSDTEHKGQQKLPAPDLSRITLINEEKHIDDPRCHGGRIRSFPHVRGNWPTFVFVKHPAEHLLDKIVKKLWNIAYSLDTQIEICEHLHISLSRTVILKYHFILEFTKSLQAAFKDFESFELSFDSVKIYCNEEKTRTFVALQVDHFTSKYLTDATKKVDDVLSDFRQQTFYNEPSYHMSILWTNGNKKTKLQEISEQLNHIVSQENRETLKPYTISQVYCKSGNKQYQFYLK